VWPGIDYEWQEGAAFGAVDYLIGKGHIDVAMLCGPVFNYTSIERYKGFARAFREHGLDIPRQFVRNTDYTTTGGYNCFIELWEKPEKPTAVFAGNYAVSLGVVLAAKNLKLTIGKDFSFFAFDKFDLTDIADPPLSTVIQAPYEMGLSVADILLKRFNREAGRKPIECVIPTRLSFTKSVADISGGLS
jgi:DNA-binding LacI/PurR family transcriptional regulator